MTYQSAPAIEPIPRDLMREPLDWLFAEHFRQRQLCREMERLAHEPGFLGDLTAEVVDFLRHDLALHVLDEEEDLFPLLRRRCLPEDDVERVLGVLSADHRTDLDLARVIRTRLEACLDARSPASRDLELKKALVAFAEQERRHVALENAVVLPIARLRLLPSDLETLSRRLAARRGLLIAAPLEQAS